jgi:hypothetical protein
MQNPKWVWGFFQLQIESIIEKKQGGKMRFLVQLGRK